MRDKETNKTVDVDLLVRCPRQSYTITRAMCYARQHAGLCRSLHCSHRLGEHPC